MIRSVVNDVLRYRDEPFAVYHLIDDCPPFTVTRELLKNAEHAAGQLQPAGRIEWFAEMVGGVSKLGLFNEGPGMSGDELSRLMDLASTGKKLGVDENYGQGGKISALKVSPHGVVYRSCKNGRVCQIILAAEHRPGLDYPVYVKRRQPVSDADSAEVVVDITDLYADRPDRPLSRDWTEVLLLGKNDSHNTVSDLVQTNRTKNWLMRLINCRFYSFRAGIIVRNSNLPTGQPNARNAEGLWVSTERHTERFEDAVAEHQQFGPVMIRYIRLKGNWDTDAAGNSRGKTMEAYGVGTRGDRICIVWRDECYEMLTGWSRISGAFGVTFGSANVAIHISLPRDAPVKNNTYRDALISREGDHQPVRLESFSELVRANRPQWLIDYIEEEARKNTNHDGVMERLRAFLEELKATGSPRNELNGEGDDPGEVGVRLRNGPRDNINNPSKPSIDPSSPVKRPGIGKRTSSNVPGIPDVSFTTDPAKLEDMQGRAAMYLREENKVILNPNHFRYVEDLQSLYESAGPDADRQAMAKQLFDEEYCFNAGKFVVQAWIYKGKADWGDREWEDALSMGSLTVHLTAPDAYREAHRRFRQRTTARKTASTEN